MTVDRAYTSDELLLGVDVSSQFSKADAIRLLALLNQGLQKAIHERKVAYVQLDRVMGDFQKLVSGRQYGYEQLAEAYERQILALTRAAESKDGESSSHIARVSASSAMLANELGCSSEYCELIYKAAQFHDAGKIGIHEKILSKTGALTSVEWRLMREHTRIGASMLSASNSPTLKMAAEIAMTHHEHFCGTGYPYGLSGESIPLCGRIVGLVDCFDTLTMSSKYGAALSVDGATEWIRERSGQLFDPQVVSAFMRIRYEIVRVLDSIETEKQLSELPSLDRFHSYLKAVRAGNKYVRCSTLPLIKPFLKFNNLEACSEQGVSEKK